MSRSMVKLIHADDFYPKNDAENLGKLVKNLKYIPKPYGLEVPEFKLVLPDSEIIFNKVLGERVIVDVERSGVFRKPNNNAIHFEDFESSEEWCFVIALEPSEINFWHHINPNEGMGDFSKADGYNALQGIDYNYKNLFEWKIHTNILLETNQCLFFRPWIFHSLYDGIVQYYRLIADNKFRVLVMGMPGSCRASISKKLNEKISNSAVLRSYDLRIQNRDVDFTQDGQLRHCYRMLDLARESKSDVTIIDMACPLPKMRDILNPDVIVWVSDKDSCQYQDLNKMYVSPDVCDIECKDDSDKTIEDIIKRIKMKRIWS